MLTNCQAYRYQKYMLGYLSNIRSQRSPNVSMTLWRWEGPLGSTHLISMGEEWKIFLKNICFKHCLTKCLIYTQDNCLCPHNIGDNLPSGAQWAYQLTQTVQKRDAQPIIWNRAYWYWDISHSHLKYEKV